MREFHHCCFVLFIFQLWLAVLGATNSKQKTTLRDNDEIYNNCSRTWPKMSLFVPIGLRNGSNRNSEWSDIFLHSLTMFWPVKTSKTSVVAILDIEMKDTALQIQYVDKVIEHQRNLSANFPQITLKYHTPKISYQSGHDRQQHVMFYADQYTEDEYIGFGDTDCLFYTHIDREDIFEDGKPVVHGRIGYVKKKEVPKSKWPASTWAALGIKQPMICMSYFPVVMKASHLKDLRKYVEKKHKTSFDQAFLKFASGKSFSQFNIMCTYMYYFKREYYKWYIHDATPWWNGNDPAPMSGQWADRHIFTAEMFKPKPFISIHVRYRFNAPPLIDHPDNMNKLFVRGLCHTVPNNTILNFNCSKYLQKVPYFEEMHMFEDIDYNDLAGANEIQHKADCVTAEMERNKRFQKCDLSYSKVEILNHFQKFNYTSEDVEKLLLQLP